MLGCRRSWNDQAAALFEIYIFVYNMEMNFTQRVKINKFYQT